MRACEDVVTIIPNNCILAPLSITRLALSSVKESFGQIKNIFNAAHYNYDQGTIIYL